MLACSAHYATGHLTQAEPASLSVVTYTCTARCTRACEALAAKQAGKYFQEDLQCACKFVTVVGSVSV